MQTARGWPHGFTAARFELHAQLNGAVQNNGRPDEFGPAARCVVSEICTGADGHRIRDSHTSLRGLKLGVQHRRVRLVVVTCLDNVFRRQAEVTAPRNIEQSAKDGLRVETRKTQPRNAAVQTDEGRRHPVTNQPDVFESRVVSWTMRLAEARVQLQHLPVLDRKPRARSQGDGPGWLGIVTDLRDGRHRGPVLASAVSER